MSTRIRLSRGGRKKAPFYKIVVANSTSPRDGRFIEKVGTYNPLLDHEDENRVTIKKDRIEYWLSNGAKPSERVAIFLSQLGVKGADKYKVEFEPRKKGHGAKKKAQELAAKKAEAQKEAQESKGSSSDSATESESSSDQDKSAEA